MIRHDYVGEDLNGMISPSLVVGIANDLFEPIRLKYRKPIMRYRGEVVRRRFPGYLEHQELAAEPPGNYSQGFRKSVAFPLGELESSVQQLVGSKEQCDAGEDSE